MDSSTAEKCGAYGVVVRDGGALTAADSTLRHNAKAGLLARGGRSGSQVPCHVGVTPASRRRHVGVTSAVTLARPAMPAFLQSVQATAYRSFAVLITGYKSLITPEKDTLLNVYLLCKSLATNH